MEVIVMCGGVYDNFKEHKSLSIIKGERLVERTIRLLKDNGIIDINVKSTDILKYSCVVKKDGILISKMDFKTAIA